MSDDVQIPDTPQEAVWLWDPFRAAMIEADEREAREADGETR